MKYSDIVLGKLLIFILFYRVLCLCLIFLVMNFCTMLRCSLFALSSDMFAPRIFKCMMQVYFNSAQGQCHCHVGLVFLCFNCRFLIVSLFVFLAHVVSCSFFVSFSLSGRKCLICLLFLRSTVNVLHLGSLVSVSISYLKKCIHSLTHKRTRSRFKLTNDNYCEKCRSILLSETSLFLLVNK